MSTITKPIILDETGQRIATALETLAQNGGGGSSSGTSIYRHDVYFEDYLDENKGYSFVIYTDSNTPIQTFDGIHAIVTALCGEHHWLSIHDENGNGQVITGVDGATTITSNLHDWTSSDIQNINDKVTPVGNGGGSSGGTTSGMYKHHVVMTCLNSCSAQDTLDIIFYTNSDTPLTETTFKAMFTLTTNGNDKGLNVPYQYVCRNWTGLYYCIIAYNSAADTFTDYSMTYTFVSLTDTVE